MSHINGDLGYGHTKFKRGKREICYPSVTGPTRQLITTDVLKKDPLDHLIDLKRDVFIGELALRQSPTITFSLQEKKITQTNTARLYEMGLGILAEDKERINVVSGLPVTFFFDQRKEMEEHLLGTRDIHIFYDNKEQKKTIYVEKVNIVPQPLGSAMDLLLDDNGNLEPELKPLAKGKIGVLDVGFFTNDLLFLDGLEVIQDYSRSLRSGMSVALKAMTDAGIDLPLYELDARLREGKFSSAKQKAYKMLAEQIIGEIETYWPPVDMLIVTGGGGEDLFPYLRDYFEANGKVVQLLGQMSNVRGYDKIGRRAWR